MKGQIYNVGLSEANVSKRELCQTIQNQLPEFVFMDAPVGTAPLPPLPYRARPPQAGKRSDGESEGSLRPRGGRIAAAKPARMTS